MQNMRKLTVFSMITVAWASLLPSVAHAAKIGVVDVGKVSETSTYFKAQLSALDTFTEEKKTSLDLQLKSLAPDMLLTPAELDTRRQLLSTPEPTPEEQQQIQALEGLHASRQQELMRLRATPSGQLTPEEQARLVELNPLYDDALRRRMEAQQAFNTAQKEIDDQETQVRDKLWAELTKAIESVAQKERLECVLQKSALVVLGGTSQEMLFCLFVDPRSDMTDAVIKSVEEANAPPEEAPPSP